MTIIIEFNKPFCIKPFWFSSRVMKRVGWGYFAVAIDIRPLDEITNNPKYEWIEKSGRFP